MRSLACLWVVVATFADATSTCNLAGECHGNDTNSFLQLQKHDRLHAHVETAAGCCVVVDASNRSKPVLARTETLEALPGSCAGNGRQAEDPAHFVYYATHRCSQSVIEGILKNLNPEAKARGRQPEPQLQQPQPQASLASAGSTASSRALHRQALSPGYTVFESFDGVWPEPDATKIIYHSNTDVGAIANIGADGTTTSLVAQYSEPYIWGIGWRAPTYPVTSRIGTTLQAWIMTDNDDSWPSSSTFSADYYIGVDLDAGFTETKAAYLKVYCPNPFSSSSHPLCWLEVGFVHYTDWGQFWTDTESYSDYLPMRGQWLRVLIQVLSAERVVVRVYDTSGTLLHDVEGDFADVDAVMSTSGTAYYEVEIPGSKAHLDELATCNTIVTTELTTDPGECHSSQTVLDDPHECIPEVTYSCGPSPIPKGKSLVLCGASDGHDITFEVEVQDPEVPVIEQLDTIEEFTCGEGAWVTYGEPDVSDNCEDLVATCFPLPGFFPVGTTNVTCTAQDSLGEAAAPMTFQVVVHGDTTEPSFSPALVNKTVDAGCADFAQVSFEAVAVDADGCLEPFVSCSPTSMSLFPIGDTTVQCKATDHSGNVAYSSFVVTVTTTCQEEPDQPQQPAQPHYGWYGRYHRVKSWLNPLGSRATEPFEGPESQN